MILSIQYIAWNLALHTLDRVQWCSVTDSARNNLVNHELDTTKQFHDSDPKDGVTVEL